MRPATLLFFSFVIEPLYSSFPNHSSPSQELHIRNTNHKKWRGGGGGGGFFFVVEKLLLFYLSSPLPPEPLSFLLLPFSRSNSSLSSLTSLSTSSLTRSRSGGICCNCTLGLPCRYLNCSMMPCTTPSRYCLLFLLSYLPERCKSGKRVRSGSKWLIKGVWAGKAAGTSLPMQTDVSYAHSRATFRGV